MSEILGKKIGMTRIFTEDGRSLPVTVVEVLTNRVVQLKTLAKDGYEAIQVTSGTIKEKKLKKTQKGHFAAAGVEPGCRLYEFSLNADVSYKVGDEITVKEFKEGQKVDVIGTSKGKGFAGTIKRHNFSSQRMSHGNSRSHRTPGSIGQCQDPGKVFKGKKMAGHLGNARVTIQNLEVLRVDESRGILLIKGAIPGAPGSDVIVKSSVKESAA